MNSFRRTSSWEKRQEANDMANQRPHPRHFSNGDEQKFRHQKDQRKILKCHEDHQKELNKHKREDKCKDEGSSKIKLIGKPSYLVSFTKGMPHNYYTGLLNNPLHFQYFVRAIDSGDPRDFRDTPLGPEGYVGNEENSPNPDKKFWKSDKAKKGSVDPDPNKCGMSVGLRAWESQSAGLAFELEGPDAQAVTMPPAPKLGSDELNAEIAEVYAQALLRDVPFHAMSAGVIEKKHLNNFNEILKEGIHLTNVASLKSTEDDVFKVLELTEKLKKLKWFTTETIKLNSQESARRCGRECPNPSTAFRGITEGDLIGPYLSQFLLIGNTGINSNDKERTPECGYITYGAISIKQEVRTACPNIDYMQTWNEWFDVQNAANLGGLELYVDMMNKASDDEKECFAKVNLKSCENLENLPSRRFIYTPRDLATYVHYDALYEAYLNACLILLANKTPFDPGIPFQEDDNRDHQQGFAHFGGPHILSLVTEVATRALKAVRFQKYSIHRRCRPEVLAARYHKIDTLKEMSTELNDSFDKLSASGILDAVNNFNPSANDDTANNYLLPMAFCEGSPMHPAYGAGHATVAGACVTILKAFFDCKAPFKPNGKDSNKAFVSVDNGKRLETVPVFDSHNNPANLTVEGELNKLASNISIGRNWAGVHYFTDYYESILMGEQIAIGILEEQKLMFKENFSMTVPLFCGDSIRI